MSEGPKAESTRVIIQIKRVWLAVRFSCKLSFIIRNQLSEKIAETDNTYNLARGECIVNETLYFELPQEVLASRGRRLKMIVMMISANGMVPAGFVNFSTHPRSPYEQFEAIMPLERCEDARAQIKFMHMYENCTRTPIENSYINHLISKQDRNPYENGVQQGKVYPASSHSLNRENLSLRKQRSKEVENLKRSPQALFNKPLVSPRMLSRNSEQGTIEKTINSFKKEAEDQIAEQKEPNDSSINPLTKEQLMKEHQQYWLEIVRMEEEMESMKEENKKFKQENNTLRNESVAMKEYYEGHEEKIHAFLGEIEENSETIKRLETEVKEYKSLVVQKDELEKEFQRVMDIQSSQFRQNLNRLADLQEKLHSATQEKKKATTKFEMYEQTITFLQGEAKKYSDENLLLTSKIKSDEDRLYFLINNNEAQKNIISQLENKITKLCHETDIISSLEEANATLKGQIQALKEEHLKDQQKLGEIQKELMAHSQSKEMLMLQSSLKEQEAGFAQQRLVQTMQELQEIKKAYESLTISSSIEQSKYKIFEKQLELSAKEKDDYAFELRRKEEELKEVKGQVEQLNDQSKILRIKLIEYEASLTGKSATIEQLRISLNQTSKEKEEYFGKNIALEKQFEEMSLLLSKEVEEKNKMTILLTKIEENYRSIEDERGYFAKAKEQLIKQINQLQKQTDKLKAAIQQGQKNHKQQKQRLQNQLNLSQEHLSELIQKTSVIEMELQSTLGKLQEQNSVRNSTRDQYQESYNQSMTALTLKNGKLERQLEEVNKNLQKEKSQSKILSQKLASKQAEVNQIKGFTHNKLQENLKFMKENGELKAKIPELAQNINKLQTLISNKESQLVRFKRFNDELTKSNKQNLEKIDQLTSELQFVTEVLQRERQQKSDIEKEFDHLEKTQLPQIQEVGHLKEDSIDEYKHDDVNLEIESKVAYQNQQISNKEGQKGENQKKKKKKQ